jgi:hypothetical protein
MQQHGPAEAAKNSKHVWAFTLISIVGPVMKSTQFSSESVAAQLPRQI